MTDLASDDGRRNMKQRVLEVVREYPGITRRQVENMTRLSMYQTANALSLLTGEGVLEYGADRDGQHTIWPGQSAHPLAKTSEAPQQERLLP